MPGPAAGRQVFGAGKRGAVGDEAKVRYVAQGADAHSACVAAAASAINAYQELYDGQESQLERQRLGVPEDKRKALGAAGVETLLGDREQDQSAAR